MQDLLKKYNLHVGNEHFIKEALVHPSLKSQGVKSHYERCEFLGDRVLGLVIADLLYKKYPQASEGILAQRHSMLVCGETLAEMSEKIGLVSYVQLSKNEKEAGLLESPSLLADACEAFIGALYLEGGLAQVTLLITHLWQELIEQQDQGDLKDAKSALQEWAQQKNLPVPKYTLLKTEGLEHAPFFTMEVRVTGYPPARGVGRTKRIAEQHAAALLLEKIHPKRGSKK